MQIKRIVGSNEVIVNSTDGCASLSCKYDYILAYERNTSEYTIDSQSMSLLIPYVVNDSTDQTNISTNSPELFYQVVGVMSCR